MKTAIIIGSGLGGLSTALRLKHIGYDVTILEKHSTPGGRLNIIKEKGYTFDLGPSFMSMTYELDELFNSINRQNPIRLKELDPLYKVFFEGGKRPYTIWKNLDKLQDEFAELEPNLKVKVEKYLSRAA
jgi:phytoene dehydrogenase-like protein